MGQWLARCCRSGGKAQVQDEGQAESASERVGRQLWTVVRKHIISKRIHNAIEATLQEKQKVDAMGLNVNEQFDESKDETKEERCEFYLHPESLMYSVWNALANLVYFASLLLTPLVICFSDLMPQVRVLDILFDIIGLIDILLNFITAYYADVTLVTSNRQIAMAYLRGYFVFDVLATLPTLSTSESTTVYFLKLFRFVRIKEIMKKFKDICVGLLRKTDYEKEAEMVVNFVKIVVGFLLVIHCLACVWVAIGMSKDKSWLNSSRSDNYAALSNAHIYLCSVYWLITTMATIGYGDIVPVNDIEMWFTMGVELCGILLFSFVMGTISNSIINTVTVQKIIEEKNEDAELWLRRLDKSGTQRLRKAEYDEIEATLFEINSQDVKWVFADYAFFGQIPYQLQSRVVQTIFPSHLALFKTFFENTEPSFRAAFLTSMYHLRFAPSACILSRGKPGSGIFLITKGTVQVLRNEFDINPLLVLPAGSYFGEISTLLPINSNVNYVVPDEEELEVMRVSKAVVAELTQQCEKSARALEKRAIFRRRLLKELSIARDSETESKKWPKAQRFLHGGSGNSQKRQSLIVDMSRQLNLKADLALDELSDDEIRDEDQETRDQFITKRVQAATAKLAYVKKLQDGLSTDVCQGLDQLMLCPRPSSKHESQDLSKHGNIGPDNQSMSQPAGFTSFTIEQHISLPNPKP